MKRDMDLARQILLAVEESPRAVGLAWIEVPVEGRSREEVSYHVQILEEAGLLDAKDLTSTTSGLHVLPRRLTWAGHESLDAAREDTVWEKAKSIVIEKTGSLTLEGLKIVLGRLMQDALRHLPL